MICDHHSESPDAPPSGHITTKMTGMPEGCLNLVNEGMILKITPTHWT